MVDSLDHGVIFGEVPSHVAGSPDAGDV